MTLILMIALAVKLLFSRSRNSSLWQKSPNCAQKLWICFHPKISETWFNKTTKNSFKVGICKKYDLGEKIVVFRLDSCSFGRQNFAIISGQNLKIPAIVVQDLKESFFNLSMLGTDLFFLYKSNVKGGGGGSTVQWTISNIFHS